MIKSKKTAGLVLGFLVFGNVAYANFGDALVGGVVGGAVGSVITNEVYNSNRKSSNTVHHKTRKYTKKRYVAPKETSGMKIQRALSSLGFYRGKIDGEVNSFETRSAIKELNIAYEISNSASLKAEEKDSLIFLGTLFKLDRYLILRGNDRKSKGKKIQAALKIHGFYHSKIDGAVGRGTRNSIAEYKSDKGLSYSGSLDFEEEYQLVSSAKAMNDKNIEDTIGSLKGMGIKAVAPTQILKMQPVNNTPSSSNPQYENSAQ